MESPGKPGPPAAVEWPPSASPVRQQAGGWMVEIPQATACSASAISWPSKCASRPSPTTKAASQIPSGLAMLPWRRRCRVDCARLAHGPLDSPSKMNLLTEYLTSAPSAIMTRSAECSRWRVAPDPPTPTRLDATVAWICLGRRDRSRHASAAGVCAHGQISQSIASLFSRIKSATAKAHTTTRVPGDLLHRGTLQICLPMLTMSSRRDSLASSRRT